jgi:hypothetical protein
LAAIEVDEGGGSMEAGSQQKKTVYPGKARIDRMADGPQVEGGQEITC